MHLCIVTSEWAPFPGGIATYYASLAELLVEAGHRVTVVTVGGDGCTAQENAVRVVRLDRGVQRITRRIEHAFENGVGVATERVAIALAVREWLRANAVPLGIDVVEAVDFLAPGAFLSEPDLPPLVITSHSSFGQTRFHEQIGVSAGEAITTGLEVASMAAADEVMTYSPANARDWSLYLGRDVKFATAPWKEDCAPREDYSASATCTAVVVGRLQRWKGPMALMEALQVCQDRAVGICVRWIGRDTATAPGGESMAGYLQRRYPSLWQTEFQWQADCQRSEVRRVQKEADFAIVPSLWDTFNFTALEAMSVGTPVLIAEGAGASYLCEEGVNGVVVPSGDSAALARAIERMAGDVELRRAVGARGLETVRRVFTSERIIGERMAVYEAARKRHQYRRERRYCNATLSPLVDALLSLDAISDAHTAERLRLTQLAELTARRASQALRRRLRTAVGRG